MAEHLSRGLRRHPQPGQLREGSWLIDVGTAAGYRNNGQMPSGARVRVEGDGTVAVETDITDIGTGSCTIIGQTAAEMIAGKRTGRRAVLLEIDPVYADVVVRR